MSRLLHVLSWPFRRLPLPVSLFLLVTAVTAVGYLLSYRTVQQNYRILRYQVEERQQQLVNNLSEEVDFLFSQYQSMVLNFTHATATALQLTGLEGAYRYFLQRGTLTEFMQQNPAVMCVVITDGLGRQLVDNRRTDITAEQLADQVHQATMNAFAGSSYLSPILAHPSKEALVLFSEPVQDAGGTRVAAITLVVTLRGLLDRMREKAPDHHALFMCDDQGRLIMHSSSKDSDATRPGTDYTFHPLIRDFLRSGSHMTQVRRYAKTGAGEFLGTYATCTRLPWVICAEISHDKAFSAILAIQRRLAWWFSTIMLGSMLSALLLAFAIRQPLNQLRSGAKNLSNHDFSSPVKVQATNEFGELADAFNDMRLSILDYLEKIAQAAQAQKELFLRALKALVNAIDAKDPYTRGHSHRVSHYARIIAKELGQSGDELEQTELSALLHDVGKIGIEDAILKKKAGLTDKEYEVMKSHPEKGLAIVGHLDALNQITDGMLYHHENWNGKGYPKGLAKTKIPLQGRIVAVADTFDAMTSDRPYQTTMTYDQAINRMLEMSEIRFDPAIVNALAEAYYTGRLQPPTDA